MAAERGRHLPRLSRPRREALEAVLRRHEARRHHGRRRPPVVAALVDEGAYATKTINNSLVVLRLVLGHLREDGVIASNPAASTSGARERIRLPAEQREMDYLCLEEIPGLP